jgi:hypothetical protein
VYHGNAAAVVIVPQISLLVQRDLVGIVDQASTVVVVAGLVVDDGGHVARASATWRHGRETRSLRSGSNRDAPRLGADDQGNRVGEAADSRC